MAALAGGLPDRRHHPLPETASGHACRADRPHFIRKSAIGLARLHCLRRTQRSLRRSHSSVSLSVLLQAAWRKYVTHPVTKLFTSEIIRSSEARCCSHAASACGSAHAPDPVPPSPVAPRRSDARRPWSSRSSWSSLPCCRFTPIELAQTAPWLLNSALRRTVRCTATTASADSSPPVRCRCRHPAPVRPEKRGGLPG